RRALGGGRRAARAAPARQKRSRSRVPGPPPSPQDPRRAGLAPPAPPAQARRFSSASEHRAYGAVGIKRTAPRRVVTPGCSRRPDRVEERNQPAYFGPLGRRQLRIIAVPEQFDIACGKPDGSVLAAACLLRLVAVLTSEV